MNITYIYTLDTVIGHISKFTLIRKSHVCNVYLQISGETKRHSKSIQENYVIIQSPCIQLSKVFGKELR